MITHTIIDHKVLGFVETWTVFDNRTGEIVLERRIAWKLTLPSETIQSLRKTIIESVEKADAQYVQTGTSPTQSLDESLADIYLEDAAFRIFIVSPEGQIHELDRATSLRRSRRRDERALRRQRVLPPVDGSPRKAPR